MNYSSILIGGIEVQLYTQPRSVLSDWPWASSHRLPASQGFCEPRLGRSCRTLEHGFTLANDLLSSPNLILSARWIQFYFFATDQLKELNHVRLIKCKQGREKKHRWGRGNKTWWIECRPSLQIIMYEGQYQTKSNSTVSNTFSPNQTCTPQLAREKAHSQKPTWRQHKVKHCPSNYLDVPWPPTKSKKASCTYCRQAGKHLTRSSVFKYNCTGWNVDWNLR